MTGSTCVVVYGASGFVGRAVSRRLQGEGFSVRRIAAPRMLSSATDAADVADTIAPDVVDRLRADVLGADVVVNAAGVTPTLGRPRDEMLGANALFPATLVAAVAEIDDSLRLIHISSAAVQGNVPVLTARGPVRPMSTYSFSKALGEQMIQQEKSVMAVSLRPASVHGIHRPMTRKIVRFARSRASTTLAPGTAPTPQMHVANVAAAVSHLATTPSIPPDIVLQPAEGFTTGGFLELLGGRPPHLAPSLVSSMTSPAFSATAKLMPSATIALRRLEVLLLGQSQETSWLVEDGFELPYTHEAWARMVLQIDHGRRVVS